MNKKLNLKLTHEELLKKVYYDPTTGIFQRIRKDGSLDDKIGYKRPDGYIQISINHESFLAHRLAWFYYYKKFPQESIDHINNIKDDNKILNLREATLTQNNFNVGIFKTNTTGFKGVAKATHGGYRATISVNNKQLHIGSFPTPEEAYEAYCQKAIELRGEFANVG